MLAYLNKLKFSLVLILLVCLINCSNFFDNRKFNRVTRDFLEVYFQSFPVQATLMGNHDYDDQLNQFNQDDIENIIRFFKLTTEKIAAIDINKLSNQNKANFQILASQLEIHLFELERRKRWQNDAAFYLQKIYDAVHGLEIYHSDTTEQRTRNLIARLDQVPKLLIEAKKNLSPSEITNLTLAIDRIDNLSRIIAFQLSSQFVVTTSLVDTLNQKSEMVVDSLENFKLFLESRLNTSTNQSLPMTPEMYQVYVNLFFDKKIKLDEIINLIDADYQKYYDEVLDLSNTILNKSKKRNAFARGNYSIDAVYDEIQNQSLNKDEIIPFCFEKIKDIKRFIDEIMNLSIPLEFDIQLAWSEDNYLPIFKLAEFDRPGLLDPETRFHCYLKPILNERDWYQQLSQLRDYNKPSLEAIMVIEAIPIHYHGWLKKLNDVPVLAKAFPDQTFVNGWHYYFAFSLLNIGYKGYDPELKYMLLRDYLRNLLLAKVEIQYYLQQFSRQQQERVLLKSKLFKKNEMSSVFNQINIAPGKALSVFRGLKQQEQLEHTCRIQTGPHFSFKEFLKHLLAPGPIPFELIKQNVVKKLIPQNEN